MSAHLGPRPPQGIPGDQAEVGHPRHGAQTHPPREMTMTSWTTTPPWRVVETDKDRLLTVQVVAYAHPPVPAHVFVAVTDADTAECLHTTHLLAFIHDDSAFMAPPPGWPVHKVAGVRYRNPVLPASDVLEKVGRDQGLWALGHKPARWRRRTHVLLDLTAEGVEFLLGPDPSTREARGAVTKGGPR